MGDPAGIGPEILAAAVVDPVVLSTARILVIGNTEIMLRAAKAINVKFDVNDLCGCDGSACKESGLNIVNMDNLNLDGFEYGTVQAQCGKASFDYIKAAVELAMAGKVDAIATPPIHKASLKAGNVPYIGHTEILADLSGTQDPLTLFQVHRLRVFFLTRHLSLMDACKAVKKDRVLDSIKRCIRALVMLGINNPRLAVAGLNPHSGDHGLFGNEEALEITPAIEAAVKEGYAVTGPKPADSVFHFALQGAWDAVLSLYHDQGHIAAKMVDFQRTIALTLGMPFLRTSVDHGTAFDIAGTGKASPVSMIEAIRIAALYAPRFAKP